MAKSMIVHTPTIKQTAMKSVNSFRLILGSRSPRRRQLLMDAGYRFAILPSQDGIEEKAESKLLNADPTQLVSELAYLKAQNVVEQIKTSSIARKEIDAQFHLEKETTPFVIVSCDSIAVCQSSILGKPNDRADAERMLRMLSGTTHEVRTGLCLWRIDPTGTLSDKIIRRVETSVLKMEPLSEEQLQYYLASGLWKGKAGAFGYQDGNDWLNLISGTASNVVGLPVEALANALMEL